ncbi:hypothetical protein [Rhodococcus sp. IEGM 1318]|uniref:hypothetical protein n=1 Tax=Rhodococcus sp. IEGM 1318 TaxID=3082226 RepID=UPI0029556117|nr:hypothetical protein [Rhodococcus sp. IEGM 1318]MDV8006766.1 hypothetical protein [Rhodococcus sp. IEGM 1318]
MALGPENARARHEALRRKGLGSLPRCTHYLDDARCTRVVHDGHHEVTDGDSVITWPARVPERTYRVTAEEYLSVPVESQVTPDSVSEIPYDEMRALLGLPDVSDYILRRDLTRAFRNMRTAFGDFAEVLVEAGQQFARNLESFTDALAGSQPKPTPPMWAIDPAHSRRRNMR